MLVHQSRVTVHLFDQSGELSVVLQLEQHGR